MIRMDVMMFYADNDVDDVYIVSPCDDDVYDVSDVEADGFK